MSEDTTNALGLDFSELTVEENHAEPAQTEEVAPEPPSTQEIDSSTSTGIKSKEKPYVNPERVKTGGSQRDKLSDEALQERMTRIREQNEKIKQRRLDVQADEDAFRKTQEVERAKQAQNRKIQSDIDRARDQNAKRKMEKVQSREWDSGKPALDRSKGQSSRSQPQSQQSEPQEGQEEAKVDWSTAPTDPPAAADPDVWSRGEQPPPRRGRGRGRGRGGDGFRGGRGRGGARRDSATEQPPAATAGDNGPSAV